jgi:hypothetical protein
MINIHYTHKSLISYYANCKKVAIKVEILLSQKSATHLLGVFVLSLQQEINNLLTVVLCCLIGECFPTLTNTITK